MCVQSSRTLHFLQVRIILIFIAVFPKCILQYFPFTFDAITNELISSLFLIIHILAFVVCIKSGLPTKQLVQHTKNSLQHFCSSSMVQFNGFLGCKSFEHWSSGRDFKFHIKSLRISGLLMNEAR